MELGGRPRGWVSAVPRTQRAKSSVVVLLPQRIVSTPPPGEALAVQQSVRTCTRPETPAIEQRSAGWRGWKRAGVPWH